ncbi:MAG: DUF72 domain-containing protein [Candidatus Andeanibacterium colombiense]|uniref:DUF72 domain-containing protein n=1 Tax=Candidatus Andeanibacterium colombiense TaxID=3121345 RepID=A0AAJ5XAT0_9SPHN|nr:MAG: DUF72 domain-containing protein [Sphingomonadaceae bacterium]
MTIRTGIGGWVYEPWRETFYPKGTRQADELYYASRAVQTIEINATFYSRQKPESFARWRDATPEGFVFALKGSRFVSNRRNLAEAGEGVRNFVAQGLVELGDKLGPIFWQLAKTKKFDADEIAAFLALLPDEHEGLTLRHAIEVGHESFACAEFTELARRAGVAVVYSEEEARPAIDERTAGFRYARLQGMKSEIETGYPPAELDRLAALCRKWDREGTDVFCFLINGAKERAPAAAMALAQRLG